MRKEIWKILKDLENDKVTTNEAYHLLCDLYIVVGQSEQFYCPNESLEGNERCKELCEGCKHNFS